MADEAKEPLTVFEIFEDRWARAGKLLRDEYSALDFEDQGLAMLGGCHGCGESLAAYNAFPDRVMGLWACRGCLKEGYFTVAAFEAEDGEALESDGG